MKTVKLLVLLIIGLGSCISNKNHCTYKGKYENGMFAQNPNRYKHNLGMERVKRKGKQFDHQNIQQCPKKKK